jgi:hypothetical protein
MHEKLNKNWYISRYKIKNIHKYAKNIISGVAFPE